MDGELLKNLLSQGLSMRSISIKLGCSLSNVRYWSKKLALKSNFKTFKEHEAKQYAKDSFKNCPRCNIVKSLEEFYTRRKSTQPSTYCKICSNDSAKERQKAFKVKCVTYKGSKCMLCGYDKCLAALEFHHLNSPDKDFSIAKSWPLGFKEKVIKELDKCVLLCANCHRETHNISDLGETQTPS